MHKPGTLPPLDAHFLVIQKEGDTTISPLNTDYVNDDVFEHPGQSTARKQDAFSSKS